MVKIIKIYLILQLLMLAQFSFANQQTATLDTSSQTGNHFESVENSDQSSEVSLTSEMAKMLEVDLQPLDSNQFNY